MDCPKIEFLNFILFFCDRPIKDVHNKRRKKTLRALRLINMSHSLCPAAPHPTLARAKNGDKWFCN